MMTINRFRYLIRNSLRSIGGNRSAYATLYVANILGLLLPLLVFGFSTYAYRAITDKHPIDIERVAVVGLPWLRLGEDLKSSILEAIPAIEECCDQFSFREHAFSEHGNKYCSITFADADFGLFHRLDLVKGSLITEAQYKNGDRVCLISPDSAESLFPDIDPIGQQIAIHHMKYTVVGVLRSSLGDSCRIVVPITSAQAAELRTPDTVSTFTLLRLKAAADKDQTKAEVERFFETNGLGIKLHWAADVFKKDLQETGVFVALMTAVSVLLTALVVVNLGSIVYVLSDVVKRAIAIKYAIGAPRSAFFMELVISFVAVGLASLVTVLVVAIPITLFTPFGADLLADGWFLLVFPSLFVTIALSVAEAVVLTRGAFGRSIVGLLRGE